jgi:hypothetical protein
VRTSISPVLDRPLFGVGSSLLSQAPIPVADAGSQLGHGPSSSFRATQGHVPSAAGLDVGFASTFTRQEFNYGTGSQNSPGGGSSSVGPPAGATSKRKKKAGKTALAPEVAARIAREKKWPDYGCLFLGGEKVLKPGCAMPEDPEGYSACVRLVGPCKTYDADQQEVEQFSLAFPLCCSACLCFRTRALGTYMPIHHFFCLCLSSQGFECSSADVLRE